MEQLDLNKVLEDWYAAGKALAEAKASEIRLRTLLAKALFTEEEGTQYCDLSGGWRLKGEIKYNRKLDERALPAVLELLPDGVPDNLIEYKPSLKLAYYRTLNDEMRAIFDECLTTKPGTPTLTLVPPPKEKG